jgi:glucosamine-6-phosphate deaminase
MTTKGLIADFRADKLNVHVFESRRQMEQAFATAVAAEMRRLISSGGRAIGVFDSAPSQRVILDELAEAEGVEWTRVIGFHLDELLGVGEDSPQSHRRFLVDRLVKRVPIAEFHELRGEAANPDAVCVNYAALLKSRPPDFAALELGPDGRLASIHPTECDFNDPARVRIVELDKTSERPGKASGTQAEIIDAPRRAISLTIPAIMDCLKVFALAPCGTSPEAARDVIRGEITSACPASILRTHPDGRLFLDRNSAAMLIR